MSYSIDIDTTIRDWDDRSSSGMSVTTFAGGKELGRMVQISLGGEYVTLTMVELKKLRHVLKYAQKWSLVDYPNKPGRS